MKATPFAAFGFIIFLCEANASEVITTSVNENGEYSTGFYFFTHGLGKVKLLETGEQLLDRTPGWLTGEAMNAKASSRGTIECTFVKDTRWVCMPFDRNPKKFPKIKSIVLTKQQTKVITNGSNIFLAEGSIAVNDRVFTAPAQIRIRSGDVNIECLEESYILDFSVET